MYIKIKFIQKIVNSIQKQNKKCLKIDNYKEGSELHLEIRIHITEKVLIVKFSY